jgi:hypothetical protein
VSWQHKRQRKGNNDNISYVWAAIIYDDENRQNDQGKAIAIHYLASDDPLHSLPPVFLILWHQITMSFSPPQCLVEKRILNQFLEAKKDIKINETLNHQ